MKWISHKLTTGLIYYTLTDDFPGSVIAAAASVIPDAIEFGPGRFIFRKHRGLSHNPLFWVITLPLFLLILIKFVPDVPSLRIDPGSVFTAITSGILLHLFLDSLSDYGIPPMGKTDDRPETLQILHYLRVLRGLEQSLLFRNLRCLEAFVTLSMP